MNILIVEDQPTDLKLLIAVLDAKGHRVIGKGSAELAVAEIKAHKPDVVLVDLKLPGMDGLTLVRLLKKGRATRSIPVVAVTGASEVFSRNDALAAGCDAYITKPVDTRQLSAQVVAATGTKGLRSRKRKAR